MWDEEYSVDEYVYGESPNDFLLEMTASLKREMPYVLLKEKDVTRYI